MRLLRWSSALLGVSVGCLLLLASDYAYAYLDPGTGSYLFQCLIGAVLAATFALQAFRHKIKAWLSRILGKTPPPTDE
jgi:uncharacterized membrane protein YGL010W